MVATASRLRKIRLPNGPPIDVCTEPQEAAVRNLAGEVLKKIVSSFETICSQCGKPAYSLGGGSLWCHHCLDPLVEAGAAFRPSITVRRTA